MIIGIPRERKSGECRVALTPSGAQELTSLGHIVLVEKSAGDLSGFSQSEFEEVGAKTCLSLEELWANCELLVKVKEPAPEELSLFREGLTVFSFLHPAANPTMTSALVAAGVTGLDYDLVTLDNGRLPILEPMSIIAGKLSVQCGASALQSSSGGRGVLLGGCDGVAPGNVLVLGAGAAGTNAAKVASGMGAHVTLLDISQEKLDMAAQKIPGITARLSSKQVISEAIIHADLVIGAVLIPGALAPKLVSRQHLQTMKKGSVLVDISIDQGGCMETSKPTTLAEPTFLVDGILHSCVANMPALVPRTSTEALTKATLPWIKLLAKEGVIEAIKKNKPLKRSVISYQEKLRNKVVASALQQPAEEVPF